MDWQQIAPGFERDGSLRDIYVLNATEADWNHVLEALCAWEPPPVFRIDGVNMPFPTVVAEVFTARATASPLLTVDVSGAGLNCHFFQGDDIEFDLDPREILGMREAEALANFMALLGQITGKEVILTEENRKAYVIARHSPKAGKVVWAPAPKNV